MLNPVEGTQAFGKKSADTVAANEPELMKTRSCISSQMVPKKCRKCTEMRHKHQVKLDEDKRDGWSKYRMLLKVCGLTLVMNIRHCLNVYKHLQLEVRIGRIRILAKLHIERLTTTGSFFSENY
jgi:hypothetical protein